MAAPSRARSFGARRRGSLAVHGATVRVSDVRVPRPLPGIDVNTVLTRLVEIVTAADNFAGGTAGVAAGEVLGNYLRWVHETERSLLFYFPLADVERLLHTPRYLTLADADRGTPRLIERLLREMESRKRALDDVRIAIHAAHERWKRPAMLVVPDTNTFMHGHEPFDPATWTALSSGVGVRVIVPVVVVDEMDVLKASSRSARTIARTTIRHLVELLGQSPETPVSLGLTADRAVTIECLLDPPGHVRLSDPDAEVVDRATYVRDMSGQAVSVVTFDGGVKFRAAAAGLIWREIAEQGDPPNS
jgi:hypothetical protein